MRSVTARASLAVGPLLLWACSSSISLGGECAPKCVDKGATPGQGDAGEGDGSQPDAPDGGDSLDAGPGDAATLPDAADVDSGEGTEGDASTGGGGLMPALQNPSFERTTGTGSGDLNFTAAMAPWFHCLPPGNLGFLRAEQNTDGVTPTKGEYFLAYGYSYVVDLPVPIYQEVELKAGTRYAFMVDVQSKSGNEELGLVVLGGNIRCAATTQLFVSDYLPNGRWVPQCVAFTPTEDLSYIALLPNNRNGIAVSNRFFIDNIRSDSRCN